MRLTLVATAVTAVVLVVVLVVVLAVFARQLTDSVDAALLAELQATETALDANDTTALESEELAQLVTRDDRMLAASPSAADLPSLADTSMSCPGRSFGARQLPAVADGEPEPVRVLTACRPDGNLLVVGASIATQEEARERLLTLFAVVLPLLLVLVALVVGRAVHAALRPVDVLTRQAAQISAGADTSSRLPTVRGDDEIARLARTLDDMLARLAVAFAREQSFVDEASHELRTPLAVLRGEVELALADLSDTREVERSLRAALGEAERLSRLADDLLVLARHRSSPARADSDVLTVVEQTIHRMAPGLPVEVAVEVPPGLVVRISEADLERVVTNLITNAVGAGAHSVRVSARRDVGDGASTLSLVVEDDGPGFRPAFLPTAFERFTRADGARTRTGTGLGLAIVRTLVTGVGGRITADNDSALGGAALRITLPTGAPDPVA